MVVQASVSVLFQKQNWGRRVSLKYQFFVALKIQNINFKIVGYQTKYEYFAVFSYLNSTLDLPELSEKLIGNYGTQNWRGITHTRKCMIDNSRSIFTKMQFRFQINGQDG